MQSEELFFRKDSQNFLSLARLIKKEMKDRVSLQILDTQTIIIEYYKQFHGHKFDRLDKVLQRDKLPKLI